MFLQSTDHLAVDEGSRGGVLDLELDSPGLPHDPQIEVLVFLEDAPRIVEGAAGIEDGERAFAEQRIQAALTGIEQLGYFLLGELLEAALRRDARIDQVRGKNRRFHASPATEECRSEYCPGCAATLRPYRNWTARCTRRSSRSTHNRRADAWAHWAIR